ncbi:MAG TPA: geranylgeranylglyceryl/heptaprenylglyceryl phosphate synthase, partial [candidate division Zixibacteria bacterium]|nr:geranylgeranylglyceryl/heptaprenylglyceryl phosphate synthase [candidate division Zixibacteria bacterium]
IVGGGIRSPQQAAERARWADAVVVGNFFEGEQNLALLGEFVDAVHSAR